MRTIPGFDYRQLKGKPGAVDAPGTYHEKGMVSFQRKEWRALVGAVVAAGGFRRFEAGETFLHAKGGKILVEIYGNIQAPAAETA